MNKKKKKKEKKRKRNSHLYKYISEAKYFLGHNKAVP